MTHTSINPRAILFPGQGAQFVGMGQDFYEVSARARETFDRADEALGMPLASICFEGPEERLAETDVCQPAILTCSAAIVAALEERGLLRREEFTAAAGLSLGEYTALWFAGSLSFEDAVRLVRARGRGMQEASEATASGMTSLLGASEEQVATLCGKFAGDDVLVAANFLAPGNIAVSGAVPALERLEAGAKEEGVRRAIRLKVAGAFHSALMAPGVAGLEAAFAEVTLSSPSIPVVSNVTAEPHTDPETMRQTLIRQVTSPVQWSRSIAALQSRGVREFLEPGPGTVLGGLLRKIDRSLSARSVGRTEEMESLSEEANPE